MDYNLLSNLQYCKDIVDGLMSLILYSHIPSAVIALLVGGYVLFKTRSLAGRVLFALTVCFSLWVGLSLSIWLWYGLSSPLMAAWSMIAPITSVMFVLVFYFIYVLVFEKNMPTWMFIGFTVLLLPVFIFSQTSYNLINYDARNCVATENTLFTNYYYSIGVLVFLLLPIVGYFGWKRAKNKNKTGIPIAIAGAELFLLAFFTTGVIAQYLVENNIVPDFGLELYGIMAMSVFMVVLSYVIVQYQQFKIKLIATQALVVAIVILIATEYTFSAGVLDNILITVTVILASVTGYLLTKSVKKEIQQREEIEDLARTLETANERQETLIHFIGHEVKGFLTKDAGAFAAISEGDFGAPPDGMKPFVDAALVEARHGVDSVSNILKASNLKKGTVTYAKEPFDLAALARNAVERAKPDAEKHGLSLTLEADESPLMVTGDKTQVNDHVLRNLIDNAINYTPSGSIAVAVKRAADKFILTVKDTGIGIIPEDMKRLFTEGGHGKDSQRVNAHSTGYGLYIAKQIVEANGGTIRAESGGEGKGSTFIVEFPA